MYFLSRSLPHPARVTVERIFLAGRSASCMLLPASSTKPTPGGRPWCSRAHSQHHAPHYPRTARRGIPPPERGGRTLLPGQARTLLGQAAQRNFRLDVIRPVLKRLSNVTGELVNLGALDGDAAVIINRIESPQPLRFSQSVGTRVVLHVSSMGKALLAFNSDLQKQVTRAGRLPRVTPNTITTVARLRVELARIREQGWSRDDEESIPGVRCVGAPILDSTGYAWSAIAVQAPALRGT